MQRRRGGCDVLKAIVLKAAGLSGALLPGGWSTRGSLLDRRAGKLGSARFSELNQADVTVNVV